MSPRKVAPRAPGRTPAVPVPGQFSMWGSEEPWEPTGCACWPPVPRGCHHCKACDTCQDCGRCAGRGCTCDCDGCPACDTTPEEMCAACGSCRCDRHDTCTREETP